MDQVPFIFGTDSFAENTEPRVPCLLLLDVSSSMAGDPIAKLNSGLLVFKDELTSHSLASKRVEVGIITFGDRIETITDFTTAQNFVPPHLEVAGMTPMGKAVRQAMTMMDHRKQVYRANGISYYRPWIFLITDGSPNDDGWQAAAKEAKQYDLEKKSALFAIGVGDVNFDNLRLFTNREPLKLNDLRFRDLFLWLSSSLKSVSSSRPGEDVPLQNPVAPSGWASIG